MAQFKLRKTTRDSLLFLVGLGGVIYETYTPSDARPLLLGIFAAMLGLPLFLRADESKKEKKDE